MSSEDFESGKTKVANDNMEKVHVGKMYVWKREKCTYGRGVKSARMEEA